MMSTFVNAFSRKVRSRPAAAWTGSPDSAVTNLAQGIVRKDHAVAAARQQFRVYSCRTGTGSRIDAGYM